MIDSKFIKRMIKIFDFSVFSKFLLVKDLAFAVDHSNKNTLGKFSFDSSLPNLNASSKIINSELERSPATVERAKLSENRAIAKHLFFIISLKFGKVTTSIKI